MLSGTGSAPSAVSWYTVVSSSSDRLGMAVRQQRQVDGVEREVAPEREQPQPGVAVDVALADLDEPPTERQQFEPGALRGAGQRVEHDVDAVPVGVAADLVGELGAARVVDVLDSHVAQQLSTLLAARRGEDLGSRGAGDRDRRLPDAAGRRSGSAPCRPTMIRARSCRPYQAVAIAVVTAAASLERQTSGGSGDRQARVAGDERAPAAVGVTCRRRGRRPGGSVTSGPTAVTTPAKSVPNCGRYPSKVG